MDTGGLRGDSVFLVTQGTVAVVTSGGDASRSLQMSLSASSEDFTLEGDVTGAVLWLPWSLDEVRMATHPDPSPPGCCRLKQNVSPNS